MPYVNIPNSDLGILVGKLLGRVEGEVRSRANRQIQELVDEFKSDTICSNTQRIENIKKRKDTLKSILLKFKQRVEKIRKITTPLLAAVTTFKVIIAILKRLPIPTTPAVTVGTIVSFSDRLEQAKEFVIQLEEDVNTINKLIAGATGTLLILETVLQKIDIIDIEIENCRNTQENLTGFNEIDPVIKEENLQNQLDSQAFNYRTFTGKEYVIEIVVDSETGLAPLRFGVVRDIITNRIVLTGERSYSSSTQILIDELKFRIETELN